MQSPYRKQSRIGLEATRNQRRRKRQFSSRVMKTLLHHVKKDWIKPMIAWNNIALIMRNKSDLDTLSMDDLYSNLKVTNETVNTAQSVYAASSKDQASTASYADDVKMDEPKITMEEYIRLEEEKARRCGKVYNWETATYGKIWYDEDVHNLGSLETKFPAIVFNDALTFKVMLSFEPTVCPLNDHKIDLRTSFDECDDEDYTVIYDENSFSYKIIYVNNLKTESENDNDKVNMPSFSSPEPEVSYSNDFNYFKDLESEFPAIVYNDALTSKLDFLTKPTINPQHIDEFNLKDETLLSESDEEEQNVLYFNNLFPFNVIYLDDLKSDTDNDNDGIDIEQPSGDMSVIPLPK
ncbi:hypothetical protein Tco_1049808, partial [Tanacetum coccineum]